MALKPTWRRIGYEGVHPAVRKLLTPTQERHVESCWLGRKETTQGTWTPKYKIVLDNRTHMIFERENMAIPGKLFKRVE